MADPKQEDIDLDTLMDLSDEEFLEKFDNPTPSSKTKIVDGEEVPDDGTDEVPPDEELPEDEEEGSKEEPDYKAFYEQVMQPFKANGKEYTLKDAQEAVRLMQQGAGFNKKLQDLAPYRGMIKTLEQNQLLDPDTINLIIDARKGNKQALAKLIGQAQVDPLDLDMDEGAQYRPNNYTVTNEQISFNEALVELKTRPQGQALIDEMAREWDEASQSAMGAEPEVMEILRQQKETGIYGKIKAEVQRQKGLGLIPSNLPFVHAYKKAGDDLVAANALHPKQAQAPQRQAVESRTVQARPSDRDAKARAAAPTRTSGGKRKLKSLDDLYNMSDEEFLKTQF